MGVGGVGGERVLDRSQDGAVGGLVEDGFHALHGLVDGHLVGDVGAHEVGGGIDVLLEAGGDVVEHADGIAPLDESVDDVGADEAGPAGNQCQHRI